MAKIRLGGGMKGCQTNKFLHAAGCLKKRHGRYEVYRDDFGSKILKKWKCNFCKKEYTPKQLNQKFCCKSCKKKDKRLREFKKQLEGFGK